MTENSQVTKEQAMEIIKKAIVYVDINDNAVYVSTKRLITYFLSNAKELDKIIKVDVDNNKDIIIYASAKPTKPGIKSIIFKVVFEPTAFIANSLKFELVKASDDVYIKIYVQQNAVQTKSDTNENSEVDF